ncbi:WxL domain-containing protein [Enterococcus termitis]|uniref:WxL domain-containing protein n=1 Tax=Enterococcus termitis TaxID=332950 RepID=A0A1E5H0W8_9ENTE|nr:WxL domain-containing protein [Enterococcus termitis]OEG18637.1 hypothetical protein BCR25_15655 [Enterococcus termitis]
MKRLVLGFVFVGLVSCTVANSVYADDSSVQKGKVEFKVKDVQDIVDPEFPDRSVNPGPGPATEGPLRIDFISKFDFFENKISNKNETYYGNAQLFLDDTSARGNFIQITDNRETGSGWLLQVRQEHQLKEETKNIELDGAMVSLDYSWTNSWNNKSNSPTVSKDVIEIKNIGEVYNLASASKGAGEGTWLINFGASNQNEAGVEDTLSKRVDKNGKPIVDSTFNDKEVHQNRGLKLFVPGGTKKSPGSYQTTFTWILSELP